MLKSVSAGTRAMVVSLSTIRGMDDIHTETAMSAATANASLGEGSELQKPLRTGSTEMRAYSEASNADEGVIIGRSSSAPNSARKSSARLRQTAQTARCSSTKWRSAASARPSRYSTNLFSIPAQLFANRSVLLILASHLLQRNAGNLFRIQKWRKLHAQRFVGAKKQRFQGALRALQNPRNFIVIKLLILVQQHGRSLLLGQVMNGSQNHFRTAARYQILFHGGRMIGNFQDRTLIVANLEGLIHGDLNLAMAIVPYGVQRQVRGDAEHPGGELRARGVILARSINTKKYFLGQILRDSRVAHHAVEEIDKRKPVLAEQKLEGPFIPGFYVQHQLDVGSCHGLHIVYNPHPI